MSRLAYRAVYAYAWDLAEAGVAVVAADLAARGINTITLAGSYHAGKFLRPKGRRSKVYFPEDGTAYFRFRPERYGAVRPVANSLLAETDVLEQLCRTPGIAANVWLVLLHNTRLGEAHPGATVANAFADRYLYSLCPSAPEVRAYALALAADVADAYPIAGLSLETPGFMPYGHGFHHEFALLRQNPWLDHLLGLCFCAHCRAGAGAAGIDAEGLAGRVRSWVEGYLAGDTDAPDDMAAAFLLADVVLDPDLAAFLAWRCTVVTSLVAEIRAAVRADATVAVIPSVARPTAGAWAEGSDLAALAGAAGVIEACFYEPGVGRIRADIADVRRRIAGAGRLRGILRPAHPDLSSRQDVIAAVAALAEAGIDDIAFYNWGHLRAASLDWMAAALAALEAR
jgi:hypothetical protein